MQMQREFGLGVSIGLAVFLGVSALVFRAQTVLREDDLYSRVEIQVYHFDSPEQAAAVAAGAWKEHGVVIPAGLYSGVVGDRVIVIDGDVTLAEAERAFEGVAGGNNMDRRMK